MRIRVDAFSGRPNPWWRLTPQECDELLQRIADDPTDAQGVSEPILGLRGFDVLFDHNDRVPKWLPPSFRLPARKGEPDTPGWLLATCKGAVDDEALESLVASAKKRATKHRSGGSRAGEKMTAEFASAACHPFVTSKRFGYWNRPWIQLNNNCYNYASNFASNTLAQPGRRTGQLYSSFTCGSVAQAARADGFTPSCNGTMRVVAMAIWPGVDFHWWRLHPSGFWAHKIGWQPAGDRDNSLRIIGGGLNPQNCDRGPYTQFCGFYYAPLGIAVL